MSPAVYFAIGVSVLASIFVIDHIYDAGARRRAMELTDEQLEVEIFWACASGSSESIYYDERERRMGGSK